MTARALSRNETHDLGMIIKERAKVLKAHTAHQAAVCMADFGKKLAAIYSFDQDETWRAATARAQEVVRKSQEEIAKRCEELGIPKSFAPSLNLSWSGRGENALTARRVELRRVAQKSIEAMAKAAIVKIEQQSLDLRTQVVALGLLSEDARLFLESLAPVEEAMQALEFSEIEKKYEQDKARRIADQRQWGADFS